MSTSSAVVETKKLSSHTLEVQAIASRLQRFPVTLHEGLGNRLPKNKTQRVSNGTA